MVFLAQYVASAFNDTEDGSSNGLREMLQKEQDKINDKLFDKCVKHLEQKFVEQQNAFWSHVAVHDFDLACEYVYKSQLITFDTPMRDLEAWEIEENKELVSAARKLEYDSFAENDCFEIVRRETVPKGKRIITSRELLQWKIPGKKVKCRCVLRGFQDNREFMITESPTLKTESFRLLLQFAADFGLGQIAVDLKTAFLQGELYEEKIYWTPPEGFRKYYDIQPDEVCIARKSIYGLADAPRKWYEKLANTLMNDKIMQKYGLRGFTRHWLDTCLFQMWDEKEVGPVITSKDRPAASAAWLAWEALRARTERPNDGPRSGKISDAKEVLGDNTPAQHLPRFADLQCSTSKFSLQYNDKPRMAVGTHVDDLLAVGSNEDLEKLMNMLTVEFKVGSAKWNDFTYRGLKITREPWHNGRQTRVSLKEYIDREITVPNWECMAGKRCPGGDRKNATMSLKDQVTYRSLVGKLQWAITQLRSDVATRVSQAAGKYGKATHADAVAVNGIVEELRERDIDLLYRPIDDKLSKGTSVRGAKPCRRIKTLVDAAFRHPNEPEMKARGGYLLTIGGDESDRVGLIGYSSKRLLRVCKSPTGAEVLSISGAMDEVDFVKHLAQSFYGPTLHETSYMYTDSGSVTTTQDRLSGKANANLHVDIALIRQRVLHKEHRLFHILGDNNAADGLTKSTKLAQSPLLRFLETYEITQQGCQVIPQEYYVNRVIEEEKAFLAMEAMYSTGFTRFKEILFRDNNRSSELPSFTWYFDP